MTVPPIVAFVGVSGAGKTELVKWLCSILPKTGRIKSNTTRERRDTDPEGEYAYITKDQFEEYIKTKSFAWFVNEFGNQYGTLSDDLKDAAEDSFNGTVYFLLIVPRVIPAARQFIEGYGGSLVCIYVECNDENETRRRLTGREKSSESIERRIRESREYGYTIRHMKEVYGMRDIHLVDNSKNDDMASAKEQILEILKKEGIINV